MTRFIEYSFTAQDSARFTWTQFADAWLGREGGNVLFTSYEGLRGRPIEELSRLLRGLRYAADVDSVGNVVERYSFEPQAARAPGDELQGTFLRKGIVGDWRSVFTRESAEVFVRHTGDRIVCAGYESSMAWMDELPRHGDIAASGEATP